MRWLSIAAALCGLSTAIACASEVGPPLEPGPAQTFVGRVDGSDVRLALVLEDGAFEAYVCGRGDTLTTHTRWFASGADSGGLEAVNNGWRLRLDSRELAAAPLSGELESPAGERLTWNAEPARAGTEEGLYSAYHSGCRAGIIVWSALDGPACEAQGSWCDALGRRGQVTPIACTADAPLRAQGTLDGTTFELIGERVGAP